MLKVSHYPRLKGWNQPLHLKYSRPQIINVLKSHKIKCEMCYEWERSPISKHRRTRKVGISKVGKKNSIHHSLSLLTEADFRVVYLSRGLERIHIAPIHYSECSEVGQRPENYHSAESLHIQSDPQSPHVTESLILLKLLLLASNWTSYLNHPWKVSSVSEFQDYI